MATTTFDSERPMLERDKQNLEIIGTSSGVEAMGGAGAAVLSIIGLVGLAPNYMAPISCIAIGAALLSQGSGVASRYSTLMRESGETKTNEIENGGGLATEFAGGIGGIVLGILALLGLVPGILIPVAVIGFGVTLVFSAMSVANLNVFASRSPAFHTHKAQLAREALNAAAGAQVLVGLAAGVLGIIALVSEPHMMVVSLVALLALGCSTLISGFAISGRSLMAVHAIEETK